MHLIVQMGVFFVPLRTLVPVMMLTCGLFLTSLIYDFAVERNLTDKTVVLFMSSMNVGLLSLLAEVINLINKRATADERLRTAVRSIHRLDGTQTQDSSPEALPDDPSDATAGDADIRSAA